MNTTLIIFGSIIFVLMILAMLRYYKVKKKNLALNNERYERIKPLYDVLEQGQQVSAEMVLPYAQNIRTRQMCYQLLDQHKQTEVFPKEFFTIEKGAESNLANWLEFPTELDACPDEMEHIKRVALDIDVEKNKVYYEVFKCRVNEPHWAAKDGWFYGVVGPYFDDSKPYDFPSATFCRIDSTVDKISPEEEAKWVHENISLRS